MTLCTFDFFWENGWILCDQKLAFIIAAAQLPNTDCMLLQSNNHLYWSQCIYNNIKIHRGDFPPDRAPLDPVLPLGIV